MLTFLQLVNTDTHRPSRGSFFLFSLYLNTSPYSLNVTTRLKWGWSVSLREEETWRRKKLFVGSPFSLFASDTLAGSCYRTVSFHVFLFGEVLAGAEIHCQSTARSRELLSQTFLLCFSAATIAPIRPLRTQSGEGSFFSLFQTPFNIVWF